MLKLSVIVPVYNVEKYIRSCLESILNQKINDDDFEVIIVNDGSTDKSMDVISDIVETHSNFIVINQINSGLSIARNEGLSRAKGEYVLFVDSDDLLINNSLANLLIIAFESLADMIVGGFIKMSDDEIASTIDRTNFGTYSKNVMDGREAFLNYFNPSQCYVWRSLYRKDFLEKKCLKFIPQIYFEDIPFTTECYLRSDKVLICNLPFYIYRQHPNSIVATINLKKLSDFNIVIKYLWELKTKENLSSSERKKLSDVIFSTFSHEMWFVIHDNSLYEYRGIIINNLKKEIPDLYFNNGIKQRVISCIFNMTPFLYLRIRHYFAER